MVLNVAPRRFPRYPRIPPALALLLYCALGGVLVQLVLARLPGNPQGFSPIFWYLLSSYDTHGNLLLFAVATCAFLLRRQPAVAGLVEAAAAHPWRIAAGVLPLFCLGALTVYRDYPLSMDEYVALFQAQAFAAGKLAGQFPPELLEQLLPRMPKNYFFTASAATGEVSASYLPGFALLVAPFAWLGAPWAANPLISALTLPAVHRLALEISGSREAAGWALALTLASPVFVVSALSYYSMPAHLLCGVLYALLLLRPTVARALLAGLVGSLALTLHNPAPHLLLAPVFLAWLLLRRAPLGVFAALAAGYLPLLALLGQGWSQHLAALSAASAGAGQAVAQAVAQPLSTASPLDRALSFATSALSLPGPRILEARIAGLSKAWTWGGAGLLALAAWGLAAARERGEAKLLGAALLLTFLGYFFVPLDQGHGWGYRYLHSAWFALPVLAGIGLCRLEDAELRNMAAWCLLLSLLLANGLRLAQVDAFLQRHLNQVPPLARAADPARAEVVFVDPAAGFYTRDMVHNDPFLRGTRLTMVYDGADQAAALMARRFPNHRLSAREKWGELWTTAPTAAN
jgi:hypothetical protein